MPTFGDFARYRVAIAVASLVGLVVLTYLIFAWAPEGGVVSSNPCRFQSGFFDPVAPAESLEQLTAESDIVVIGEVTGFFDSDVVYPDGCDPSKPEPGLPAGVNPGLQFTNMHLDVERYLKGDGSGKILLRQFGDLASGSCYPEFPTPEFGKTMLLFLTYDDRSGENVWASHRGPWGRLIEERGDVRYANGDKAAVPFLSDKRMSDVINDVEGLVAQGN
jgi:hypothetical protein